MEKGWVEVYITAHEYKASMAKDLLDNENIKAIVLDQHDTAYKSFGESSVYVAKADKEKAIEILKKLKH